jgi:hypothetical protein
VTPEPNLADEEMDPQIDLVYSAEGATQEVIT